MGKKIIVVDDDPVIRSLISEIISSFGHTVEAFENGETCLEKLLTELPDVLVLDLQMPGMDGNQVLAKLRDNKRTADVPVIMLSANSDAASDSPTSLRADRYVQKPFNVTDFISALEHTSHTKL